MVERQVRVLLVDDHALYRAGLRRLLGEDLRLHVVGEAATGEDGVAAAARLEPDVVLMDLRMPGIDGVEATRRIRAARPATAVLVLTVSDEDDAVLDALAAGAAGYLLKATEASDLGDALVAAAAGRPRLAGTATEAVLAHVRREDHRQPHGDVSALTDRQREVLALVAAGLANDEIAARLLLSEGTVKRHVSAILEVLGARNRAHAAALAGRAGLGADAG